MLTPSRLARWANFSIGTEFRRQTGFALRVNDMSLAWGGLFEIGNDWQPPHGAHREGENADIEYYAGPNESCVQLTVTERMDLLLLILRETGRIVVIEGDHFHLNREKRPLKVP